MVLPDFGLFHPHNVKQKRSKRLKKDSQKRRMGLAKAKGLHQFVVHGSQASSKDWPKAFS